MLKAAFALPLALLIGYGATLCLASDRPESVGSAYSLNASYFDDEKDLGLYPQLLEDNRLDVTVAVGYTQEQSGSLLPSGKLDPLQAQRVAVSVTAFLSCCSQLEWRKALEAEGEQILESEFSRGGIPTRARVRIIYPVTGDDSAALKRKFAQALAKDDAIVYVGHSRHGDGFPDFGSPLLGNGKLFEQQAVTGSWMGFDRGYFPRTRRQILFLNACETDRYYHAPLRNLIDEKDPVNLNLILTSEATDFEDYGSTTSALISGLVHGRDPKDILQSMEEAAYSHRARKAAAGITAFPPLFVQDGFFSRTATGAQSQ